MKIKLVWIVLTALLLVTIYFVVITTDFSKDIHQGNNLSTTLAVTPIATDEITDVVEEVIDNFSADTCLNSCVDCDLFPVSKTNALRSDHSPSSVIPFELNASYFVNEETNSALKDLFNEAKIQNQNLTIISAYRSYNTQVNLFNSYVANEEQKSPGINHDEAVKRANVYSAMPGHSEHQLGTTVDLNCTGCTAFANNTNNIKIYEFIKANANNFGFVVSYPEGTTEMTGYKYEPWHIRFIGKELANEYKIENGKVNGLLPLETFLKNKCNDIV